MNFPKTDLPQLGLVLVVLAFTWSLKSVAQSSCHDESLLVLSDPACLFWVSPYSLVGFLLCCTPHLKATFYTFVTGRFNEDVSTASLCRYVYTGTGDPQVGACISVAQDCSPGGGKECVPPVQLAAGLMLGALKLNCVLKQWLKSITLTFTDLRCKESFAFFLHHHFGFVLFFIKVLTVHI